MSLFAVKLKYFSRNSMFSLFYRFASSKPNNGKLVTFSSKNTLGDCKGVLFGNKPSPGVIVIHEWWGLNEQIQQEGEMISREGKLTVLVPDFYRGKVATDNETAGHLMNNLDWPGALKDISGAANYLKSLGCQKVCQWCIIIILELLNFFLFYTD